MLRRWCRPLPASELWEAISVLCKWLTFRCIIISENRLMQVLPKGLNLSIITHQRSYVNMWIFSCMNIENVVVISQNFVNVHVFQFWCISETELFFFLLSHTFPYLLPFTYCQNYIQCPKFFFYCRYSQAVILFSITTLIIPKTSILFYYIYYVLLSVEIFLRI